MASGPALCIAERMVRRIVRAGLTSLAGIMVLASIACLPPSENRVLSTIDGTPIDMADVDPILGSDDLTEDQKRDRLLEIGVPADIVETLLASQPEAQ